MMAKQVLKHSNATDVNNALSIPATNVNGIQFEYDLEFDKPPSEPPPPVPSSTTVNSSLLTVHGANESNNQSRPVTPITELIQKFTAELQKSETRTHCVGRKSSVSSSPEVLDTWKVPEEHGPVSQTLDFISSLDHGSSRIEAKQYSDTASTNSLEQSGTISRKIADISLKWDSHSKNDRILDLNTNFMFQRQPSPLVSEIGETYTRVFVPNYEKRRLSSLSSNETSSASPCRTNTNKDEADCQVKQNLQKAVSESDSMNSDEPTHSFTFPPLKIPEPLCETSTKIVPTSLQLHSVKHKLHSNSSSLSSYQQPLIASATASKSETGNPNDKWKHTVHPLLSQRYYTPQPVRKTYVRGTQHRSKMSSVPVKSLITKFSANKHQEQ